MALSAPLRVHQDPPESAGLAVKLAVTLFLESNNPPPTSAQLFRPGMTKNAVNGFVSRRHEIRSLICSQPTPYNPGDNADGVGGCAPADVAVGSQIGSHRIQPGESQQNTS